MKITVFTTNQPRHLNLIRLLSQISDECFAVIEANTVFPGRVEDFFKKTDVMRVYFSNVIRAERRIFGHVSFTNPNSRCLVIKMGDLNLLDRETLSSSLDADIYVVFGASYIKGWLIDHLVANDALNIHMGLSPFYRGSSCNFWALYDENPHLVGATIHMLSKSLDSGPILYHTLPAFEGEAPFEFTMRSVLAAQTSLAERIADGSIFTLEKIPQDRIKEIRYTRNVDFTDEVAKEFLSRNMTPERLGELLEKKRDLGALIKPVVA